MSVAASSSEREDRRDAPARKKRQAKRIVERKPKPKPGARRPPSADQGDSAAIPFLRYREHVDDDLDGDHEGPKVEITSGEESMPSMALEGDASTDLADSDMSENHDAGPDGDSLRFRDA